MGGPPNYKDSTYNLIVEQEYKEVIVEPLYIIGAKEIKNKNKNVPRPREKGKEWKDWRDSRGYIDTI